MAKRSFGGFACGERLSSGFFGELFQARNKAGVEARVCLIKRQLSERQRFAKAMAEHGTKLRSLSHPNIVSTQLVGRGKDGLLVVITQPVEQPISLLALLEKHAEPFPKEVALGIGISLAEALAHAHKKDVVHGAIHPRSVCINNRGESFLGDFACGRALASAAAAADDSELLVSLRGYVAPELALGQEPDKSSDVFALGSLLSQLFWRRGNPREQDSSKLADCIGSALQTDLRLRPTDGGELATALKESAQKDGLQAAIPGQIIKAIRDIQARAASAGLQSETESLLDSLGLSVAETVEKTSLDKALEGMDDDFLGLEDSVEGVESLANETVVQGYSEEELYDEEPTAVDDSFGGVPAVDPVEALINERGGRVAVGAISSGKSLGSKLPPAEDYIDDDETPLPPPRPFHADGTVVGPLVELVGRQATQSSPFREVELPEEEVKKSGSLRWVAIIAFFLAVLVTVAYTQRGRFISSKREALQQDGNKKPAPSGEIVGGAIEITSETEDAAVWLLLGRTPVESFTLPSSMVHELRIEHEGYETLFHGVAAEHWSGEDSSRVANLSVSLRTAELKAQESSDFPPEHSPKLSPAGAGQGRIRIKSAPEGAEVWLWVGTTPTMELRGIEAGKAYEFKVLKKGYRPAFVAFEPQSWYLSGTSGPMRPRLSRKATLHSKAEAGKKNTK